MYVSSSRFHDPLSSPSLALSVAYLDADVLHQDISEGNIMVTEDGRGILNDWDCAWRKTPECPKQVHRVVRHLSI